jgi:hypothetical protein
VAKICYLITIYCTAGGPHLSSLGSCLHENEFVEKINKVGFNYTAVQPTLPIFLLMIRKHCFFGNLTVLHTAVTCIAVPMTLMCKYDPAVTLDLIFDCIWLPLKGKSIEKTYIGKLSYNIYNIYIWGLTKENFFYHSGVIDTVVTKIGDFVVDFLCLGGCLIL